MGTLIPSNLLQLLGEACVRQPVAEWIGHFIGVAPDVTHKSARRRCCVIQPEHLILIPGLIILIANVDILGVYEIAVAVELVEIGELKIAKVLHRGA